MIARCKNNAFTSPAYSVCVYCSHRTSLVPIVPKTVHCNPATIEPTKTDWAQKSLDLKSMTCSLRQNSAIFADLIEKFYVSIGSSFFWFSIGHMHRAKMYAVQEGVERYATTKSLVRLRSAQKSSTRSKVSIFDIRKLTACSCSSMHQRVFGHGPQLNTFSLNFFRMIGRHSWNSGVSGKIEAQAL